MKKRLLKKSRLYVIIDKDVSGNRSLLDIASKIRNLGACVIQLRDKNSKKEDVLREAVKLRKLLLKSETVFIVNDYIDIAKMISADGIHLGQDDSSIEIARKILGRDKIIGVSCHSLRQAEEAQKRGADYISIGPVFSTSTKPQYRAIGLDVLKEIKRNIKIPFFAIGGINENNVKQLLAQGVKRVAGCRVICQARNIKQVIENFQKIYLTR